MTRIVDAGLADRRAVRAVASRYLAFVSHAFDVSSGRFKNFMTYSRQWRDETGSEDCHGRALWALGTVVGGAGGSRPAQTEDFRIFERYGVIMQPDDKDAALLPRRIDGAFALIHRPMGDHEAHIWITFSPDLRNWGSHKLLLTARKGAWWDANKIGLSPPLIETARGWLMIYHCVRTTAAGALYRLGLALFDLDRPEQCTLRGDQWGFGPEAPYELSGDVSKVAFPCGYTIGDDGDAISLYYGAADTSIALATASIRELLACLDRHGSSEPPHWSPGTLSLWPFLSPFSSLR